MKTELNVVNTAFNLGKKLVRCQHHNEVGTRVLSIRRDMEIPFVLQGKSASECHVQSGLISAKTSMETGDWAGRKRTG